MFKKRIPYKWELIVLLWGAFFLNQGDRQVFNVVIPLLKSSLKLTDVEIGLVATIFTLLYGILVPFSGYAGDAIKKNKIVILSLLIFSIGTTFTGLSSGLFLLIVFRSISTGIGEAFYYPSANALIGEFHYKTRAQAMAIHQTALYIGIVVSGFIAGYIGEHLGWRMSFLSFGLIGVLWAVLLIFRLKGSKTIIKKQERVPFKDVLHYIKNKPTLFMLSLAFGGFQFVMVGYLTWMPTFLHDKFNLSLSNAGFSSVFYHHALAFVGVLIGGKFSDRLSVRRKQIRFETEYLSLLLGAPFIYWIGAAGRLPIVFLALGGYGFFRGIYDSNLFAALFDVIEPKYRSSATGFMLSIAFIISSLSPVILGWIKEKSSLSFGFSILGFVYLLSAIIIFLALKFFFHRDFIEVKSDQKIVSPQS